jgi:heme/copper-type cytochrome/quinol oxidase subunit 3
LSNEDADSAHAEQVRAMYNEKSKEFHKVLIIVLGSVLFFFCRLFGAHYATIVKGGDLIETKQESIAYTCRISQLKNVAVLAFRLQSSSIIIIIITTTTTCPRISNGN